MRKNLFVSVFAAAILFVATVAFAQSEKAFYKNGLWHVDKAAVELITGGYDAKLPVLTGCGENELEGGIACTAWLQNPEYAGVYDQYTWKAPAAGSSYWTLKVPEELKAVDKVEFNLAQMKNGKVNWAQIHRLKGQGFPLRMYKHADGTMRSAIVLPTK